MSKSAHLPGETEFSLWFDSTADWALISDPGFELGELSTHYM
jgi:hypothetical protein